MTAEFTLAPEGLDHYDISLVDGECCNGHLVAKSKLTLHSQVSTSPSSSLPLTPSVPPRTAPSTSTPYAPLSSAQAWTRTVSISDASTHAKRALARRRWVTGRAAAVSYALDTVLPLLTEIQAVTMTPTSARFAVSTTTTSLKTIALMLTL